MLLDDTVLDEVKRRFKATLIKDDPVAYAHETLGVWLWSKQREIIESLEKYNRVAVRSCHDSGKSFVAAVICARWLDVHPVGQARVITTAPSGMQVKGILWVEINQLHERAHLPGRVNQTEWWIGSYMAGIGRKPADYRPETFQGLHARYPLIVIDEAGGVNAALIDAVETLATNINAKILMIGNPDDPQAPFADIHADPDKYGYHTIRISAWDTPNFTAEAQELLANPSPVAQMLPEVLLSPAWVEGRRKAWGEDHPFWQSKIEAEFPSQDTNAIVRLSDVVHARIPLAERTDTQTPSSSGGPETIAIAGSYRGVASAHEAAVHAAGEDAGGPPSQASSPTPQITMMLRNWPQTLGVDVAGSDNGDETVIRLVKTTDGGPEHPHRVALLPTNEWRVRSGDPAVVADKVMEAIIVSQATRVNVDSIGVGFGIIGLIRERLAALGMSKSVKVIGINGASQANDPKTYGNLRAELWWTVGRFLFERGLIDTSLADNLEEMEAQLLMPRYKISKGRIYVEAKEDIKQRLGRSPDNADALVYAIGSSQRIGVATIQRPPDTRLDNRTVSQHQTSMVGGQVQRQRFGITPQTPVFANNVAPF
jgi:hypothetical protein